MKWELTPPKWNLGDKKAIKQDVIKFLESQKLSPSAEYFLDPITPKNIIEYINSDQINDKHKFKSPFGEYDYNELLDKTKELKQYIEQNNLSFDKALKGTPEERNKWTKGILDIFTPFPMNILVKTAPDSWIQDATDKIIASKLGTMLGDYYNSFEVAPGQEVPEAYKEATKILGEQNALNAFKKLQEMVYGAIGIIDKEGRTENSERLGLGIGDKYLKLADIKRNANDISKTGFDFLNENIADNLSDVNKFGGGGMSLNEFKRISNDLWNFIEKKK